MEQSVQFLETAALGLRGHISVVGTGRDRSKFIYSSALLLDVLRMCRHIKGNNLKQVLQRAVNIVFPHILQSAVRNLFSGEGLMLPSKATRHRSRLSLDTAMIMLFRQDLSATTRLRFGWADSSPQHSRDWLLSAHDSILEADLARVASAVDRLIDARIRREAHSRGGDHHNAGEIEENADSDEDDQEEMLREQTVAQDHEFLMLAIQRHDHVPTVLGRGGVKAADKVAALLHAWALESADLASLLSFTRSHRSFTTDMGTELSVASFESISIHSLLPPWLPKNNLGLDVEQDVAEQPGNAAGAAATGAGAFLPHSISMPGVLHILFNLSKELAVGMPEWDWFWDSLKMVENY